LLRVFRKGREKEMNTKEEPDLTVEEELEYRTKALELAITMFDDYEGEVCTIEPIRIAQRFYTYITKGE
jgi:hypothetical protein